MPRPAKGPRLYLKRYASGARYWIIRDGTNEIGTGCVAERAREAEQALGRYLTDKHTPPRSSRLAEIPVADVLAVYLREHAPHVANVDFLRYTAGPIGAWWSHKTLADIRGASCREYVVWRTAQKVSDQTARHDLKTLRAAINYFHREYGPLDAVPVVTLPAKGEPRKRWLRWQEARALLTAAQPQEHLRRFVILGLHTGNRSGTTLGLRWAPSKTHGWIDLKQRTMVRRGSAVAETAKKTPTVKIPDQLMPHLERWYAVDFQRGWPWVVHYDGAQVKKLRRSWDTARTIAGLDADVTPHTLRHTHVTWKLRAGEPPWQVAGFVGMSLAMLDQVYGHHATR